MGLRSSAIAGYAPFIGLRYSFSRKRNRFTSVIAMVSMLGMVIGVASLIAVLAVMNGFAGELRGRILSLVPHGYVQQSDGAPFSDWDVLRTGIQTVPGVVAVSPYVSDKVIFRSGRTLRGGVLTAIDPQLERDVSRIPRTLVAGSLDSLTGDDFHVVLGSALARILGVGLGDRVEVTVPRLTLTPLGVFPRSKRLTVTGLFEVGAQPDTYQAYVSLPAGQKLMGEKGSVDGLQVRTRDLFAAPGIMASVMATLPPGYRVRDWSQTQGSLFRAVRMDAHGHRQRIECLFLD